VRTEERRTEFLRKRAQFRHLINGLASAQADAKSWFRERKAETLPIHRSEILNPMRTDIVFAKNELRYRLLAYAMFRGKPYVTVEQKAATPVRSYNIWEAFRDVGLSDTYTKAGIELWLAGKIPDFQIDVHTDGRVTTKYTDAKIPESVFQE